MEQLLDDVRRLIEIHEPAHVEAVIEALMSGILALELLGGVDGELRLQAAVVEINEIELRLPRLGTERIACREGVEVLDRTRVVLGVHGRVPLLIKELRSLVLDHVAAVAPCEGGRGES